MPTHRTDEARLTVITRAYVVQSPLASSAARPHRVQTAHPVISHQHAATQDAAVDPGNFGKGLAWALIIEGAAGLAIYALWQLWRLLALHF